MKQKEHLKLYQQLNELTESYVTALRSLPLRPQGWLPHIVYVEEEGDYPVYTRYWLDDINPDGSCTLRDFETGEIFTKRSLNEINIEWLDTVYCYYLELADTLNQEYVEHSPLQERIREEFFRYVEDNGCEPDVAVCDVTFIDDGTTVEVKIQLSVDSNPETDDEIFFYCNGLESLVSMTEPGVEFTVTGFSYFDRYELLND